MATVRQYRGRYVADFRDQTGRRRIEVPEGPFETRAEEKRAARELLDLRLGEIKAHTYTPDRARLAFGRLCELFLASKVRARSTTVDGYRELIGCYLVPYFGIDRKVESLTRFEVEGFRNAMAKGTPSAVARARDQRLEAMQVVNPRARLRPLKPGPRTTNKCLTLLVGILGYAVEHGFAARNAAASMEKLPAAEGNRVIEQNVLTPAEVRKVIQAAVPPFRMPVAIAALTGARQAEVLGLQWGDIDWNRRTAEIRRQWRRGAFFEPKTRSSRRTIELPDDLIADLKRWRLECPKGQHDLVCPAADGRPLQSSDLLRTGFLPALRRAGVRQVRYHDLRHSFASNLLAAGVDVVTVSKALGHANVHITLTCYSHSVPRSRQGAADAMARLMRDDGNKMETLASTSAIRVWQNDSQVADVLDYGEVAERLNAPVLKTGKASRPS